jgi:hypothetical protein
MIFHPLVNYAGYEHVLNALPCFIHPNGNVYGVAVEKQGGTRQNLACYRVRPGATGRELAHRFVGGIDSVSQIAAGGCLIDHAGNLIVWASAVPQGMATVTKTGFVGGYWDPIPGIDDPWSYGAGSRPAVPIPAGGAIAQLYTGVYTALDFDTPAETALRVQKQLDAIQEAIALLQQAGVLV